MNVLTAMINGKAFGNVLSARVGRDLEQIAGTFDITVLDEARLRGALLAQIGQPTPNGPVNPGDTITILVDGEPLLTGTIEQMEFVWSGSDIGLRLQGRDKTGKLVDCTPPPTLPVEFRGVDLLYVANQVTGPFGITASADVDIGAPFDRLTRHKHQTVMEFLESATRQRSVLLTSDGIGGLKLTRSGQTRAPAPLGIGDNVQHVDVRHDWSRRFSEYWVMQDKALTYGGAPGLGVGDAPGGAEPADTADASAPAPGTATGTMGHATDPEITEYRPTVRLTRSQSGMSTLQEQAEWMARVAKGNATVVRMVVRGFRAGTANGLWRPNQLTSVYEPYSGTDRDMLIAGVEFEKSASGSQTTLRVVGPSAYDRINEAERRRHRHGGYGRAGGGAASHADLITTVPGT